MIGIVVSIFNKPITDGLLKGCIKSLKENGLTENDINIFHVPGAFELPGKVKKLTKNSNSNFFIDLPIGRIKPPNNRYTLDEMIPVLENNKNVKF